tara:strand:- start:3027 stop:3281 length:255 start_codon:yes stop_codon:yes gene_type:complete
MTRLKDQIRLAKLALEHPELYNDAELMYMKKQLRQAKLELKKKKQLKKRGFGNESSETGDSDTRRRTDDGVRGTSEQPEQPGEP